MGNLFGSIITSFALQRRCLAAEDGSSGLGRLSMVGCVSHWSPHSQTCVWTLCDSSAPTLVPPKPFPFLLPLRIGFGKNYFLQANAKKCISWSDEQMLCCQCQGVSRQQRTFPFIAKIGHTHCWQKEMLDKFYFQSRGCAEQGWATIPCL